MDPTKGPNRALSKNNKNTILIFLQVNSYRLQNMGPIIAIDMDGYVLDFRWYAKRSTYIGKPNGKTKAAATFLD